MTSIKQYHLHKDNYAQLHFEINDAAPYVQRHAEHCFKPHRHSFYQLIWFEEAGSHYVDYEVFEHPAHILFFLDKNQVHYFCPDAANKGKLFHFNELFLDRFARDNENKLNYNLYDHLGQPFMQLMPADIKKLDFLSSEITSEIQEKPFQYQQQVYLHLQSILLLAERLKREQIHQEFQRDYDYELLRKFRRLLEDHLKESLSIEDFANLLVISKKKLTAITKKFLKTTPAQVIQQRKILEAKRLLANTNISIKEVAYQLGFDQATYFTKYFKKHTSLTPKQFVASLP